LSPQDVGFYTEQGFYQSFVWKVWTKIAF
jgi:hypothetical protein